VGWLIAGLLGLAFLGELVVFFRGRGRSRPLADDTLVTDLLGPPGLQAVSAPQAREEGEPPPATRAPNEGNPFPAPQAREEGKPSPAQAGEEGEPSPASAPPAGEDDWLEAQLAWINAWSQRMNQQITPAGQPEPHGKQ
jgi:hypothetical protein